ncbi:MAG: hypothetical protein ABI831_20775 [Betaproteobacteria bacterium]
MRALPAPSAPRASQATETNAATDSFIPTHRLKRTISVYNAATVRRKTVGRLNKDTPVIIEEHAELATNNRSVDWVRVSTKAGPGGWLPASELVEGK